LNTLTAKACNGFPLTVLQTAPGLNASKTITRDANGSLSKKQYGSGYLFRFRPQAPNNLEEMATLLERLALARDCFVVRGAPIEGLDLEKWHKRRYKHVEGDNALRAVARSWGNLDIDDVAIPEPLGLAENVRKAALYVRDKLLPEEFCGARCVLTPTSSTGLAGAGLARFRLWFQFDRVVEDEKLRRWALGCKAATNIPLDHSVFNPAQPCYTARPLFIGMTDPVNPGDYALILPGDKISVAIDVERFTPRYEAIKTKVEAAAVLHRGNWRKLALATVGGPEGFFEPLTRAIGTAVRVGAPSSDIHDFLNKLVSNRADTARRNQYGFVWREAAIARFRKFDVAADAAERKAAFESFRNNPVEDCGE
jgi:hypothetical protein